MLDFTKGRYNDNGTEVDNQLYVEYGMKCQSKCQFCRNNTVFCGEVCLDEIDKTIKKQYPKCRRIIFGGGEPLFELPRIMSLIKTIKEEEGNVLERERVSFQLITNGEKTLFENYLKSDALRSVFSFIFSGKQSLSELDNIESENCSNCHLFDKIIISRHHYNDTRNQEIFKSSSQLLSTEDFKSLCGKQKKTKIQFNCICQKGEIDSVTELMNFIHWTLELGARKILFSNLEKQTTPNEYFAEKNLSSKFWDDVHIALEKLGMKTRETNVIYTSAGYKTTSYYFSTKSFINNFLMDDNDECIIILKEYCDFDNALISKSNNFNLEYTVRPNGEIICI